MIAPGRRESGRFSGGGPVTEDIAGINFGGLAVFNTRF